MSSLFTKIIKGEIPCHKIAEDDRFFAFMDIRPISHGHVLVVPKDEVDHFFDMKEADLSGVLLFAKPIVKAIESVVECERVGLMVAGLEVPHAHLHLVPISEIGHLSFEYAKPVDDTVLSELSEKIRDAYQLVQKGAL
ncbi:HIT family protein [Candidatus Marinamargulisbacteria bacterium SCGC AG-439-L15]|nr:HIT family protein [Candidatus Marinamargulisbacteria bacterium SCGC AG-439-L15]